MSSSATAEEMRHELQRLLSEEHDLIEQAVNAIAAANYVRLRDAADLLVKVTDRRTVLRAAVAEARAREAGSRSQGTPQRRASDQIDDTWRRLH